MRALWTAATGMQAQQLTLDVVANNLANVQTAGFKRSRVDFQDLVYETLQAPGAASAQGQEIPTGFQVGHGSRAVATQRLFIKGDLQQTGNALDLAIEGDGFFQVQQPTGETAYSRVRRVQERQPGAGGHLRWICHRTANHYTGQRAQYYRRRRRDRLGLVARPDPAAAGWDDRNRRASSIPPAWLRKGAICFSRPKLRAMPRRELPGGTVWELYSKASSKDRTSTWSKKWSA